MLTFLFWNINKKPLYDVVADLSLRYEVDVVVVAECPQPGGLVEALNSGAGARMYDLAVPQSKYITVALRFSGEFAPPVDGLDRATAVSMRTAVHHVRRRGDPEPGVVLVAAHLPCRNWADATTDRMLHGVDLAAHVADAESRAGHRRTLLVGDLNDNPYQNHLVHPRGLHAMMTRELAKRLSERRPPEGGEPFYNPMWAHMGELAPGPPGTYYYDGGLGGSAKHYWHVFDQLLIRPALLDVFDDQDVRILDQRDHPMLRIGRGSPADASDHLPLLFSLRLP